LVAGGDNEVRSPTVGAARPLVAGGYNEVPNPTVDLPCRYKFEECYREHEMRSSAGTRSQGRPPCRAVHAEQRAILSAKEHIGDLSGCILYTTTFPCDDCARMTVLTKISEVVFAEPYPSDEIDSVLANNSVTVRPFEGVKGPAFLKLFGRLSVTVHALAEAHR
jgi:deoxycytidylate deaminase